MFVKINIRPYYICKRLHIFRGGQVCYKRTLFVFDKSCSVYDTCSGYTLDALLKRIFLINILSHM